MKIFPPYLRDYTRDKLSLPFGPLDEKGVPLYRTKKSGLREQYIYHPTVIIQFGLANYDRWRESRKASNRLGFERCVDWLVTNVEQVGDVWGWPSKMHLRTPRANPPWFSGMTQGQGISLLLRAYALSPRDDIKSAMDRVLKSFLITTDHMGVISVWEDDVLFVEEVGVKPELRILNGALYGFYGIKEYQDYFVDEVSAKLQRALLRGLQVNLAYFDTGFWSRYCIGMRFSIADSYYHGIHIIQLERIGREMGLEDFTALAKKFERYQGRWLNRYFAKALKFFYVNLNRTLHILGLSRLKYK